MLVVDGERERLIWLARVEDHYDDDRSSALPGVAVAEVAAAITWPRQASR